MDAPITVPVSTGTLPSRSRPRPLVPSTDPTLHLVTRLPPIPSTHLTTEHNPPLLADAAGAALPSTLLPTASAPVGFRPPPGTWAYVGLLPQLSLLFHYQRSDLPCLTPILPLPLPHALSWT